MTDLADAMTVACTLSPREKRLMCLPVNSSRNGELCLNLGLWAASHHFDAVERLFHIGLIGPFGALTPDGIYVRTALFRSNSND